MKDVIKTIRKEKKVVKELNRNTDTNSHTNIQMEYTYKICTLTWLWKIEKFENFLILWGGPFHSFTMSRIKHWKNGKVELSILHNGERLRHSVNLFTHKKLNLMGKG